jgi:hypothetical protein
MLHARRVSPGVDLDVDLCDVDAQLTRELDSSLLQSLYLTLMGAIWYLSLVYLVENRARTADSRRDETTRDEREMIYSHTLS